MSSVRPVPLHTVLHHLRAIAESTRLRILCLLAFGELTVTELTRILGQSQPRVSRHLKILLEAGLVERLSEGAWVFYRLADGEGSRTAGGLARALAEALDDRDPLLAGDRERLGAVKAARAAQVREYFETHATDWIRLRSLYQPVPEVESAVSELLGTTPIDLLIDLGTGTGRMLEALSPYYRRGIGLDVSPAMLRVARVNLEHARIRHAHVRHGNLLSLPRFTEKADAVVIHQVLHYLDNPEAAVGAAAQLLAANGRLLIADFAPHDLERLRSDHAHRRLGFAGDEVARWCRKAGLELRATRRIELPPEPSGNVSKLAVSVWLATAPARKSAPAENYVREVASR